LPNYLEAVQQVLNSHEPSTARPEQMNSQSTACARAKEEGAWSVKEVNVTWRKKISVLLCRQREKPRKTGFLRPLTVAGMLLTAVVLSSCAVPQSALSPAGPAADRIATLWWIMFAVAAVVFLIVMALLLVALLRRNADRSHTLGDGRKLVVWAGAVIPAIILSAVMGLAIFYMRVLAAPPTPPRVTVEVIGHQWWWEVRYPDLKVTTANEIHIPAGEPVLVKVSTADVIHSFWVPELQGKIDMIPGQAHEIWLQAQHPGLYRGQCAEYCGTEHAKMAFLVIAEPADQFQTWAQAQAKPAAPVTDPQLVAGQQVFLSSACVYCHTIQGTNATSPLGPDLTHLASRQMIGAGVLPNARGSLAGWIINSQSLKPGNRMPPMQLSADQLQALLDYLQSLK
jgi:cytochrome c oxidase subunit II